MDVHPGRRAQHREAVIRLQQGARYSACSHRALLTWSWCGEERGALAESWESTELRSRCASSSRRAPPSYEKWAGPGPGEVEAACHSDQL